MTDNVIEFDFYRKHALVENEADFIKFLEEGGFIKTDIDDDGDLELIPIKQIVEQHNNIKEKDYETRNIL